MPRRISLSRKGLKSYDDNCSDGEEKVGGGINFYINKGGLPLDNSTWERMWDHVIKIHPDGAQAFREIREERNLPEVSYPHAPVYLPANMGAQEKVDEVQYYLQQLQYNHTGTQFFEIKKNRPICGLMECAKDMIRESLPIKCLEAVVLGIYLTNSLTTVDRFAISFRSTMRGNVYRHVVLGLHSNGRYGALGLSRRDDLMYKPFEYTQLSEMIINYQNSYKKYSHTVDKIKIGLAIPHDMHTYQTIQWRGLCLKVSKLKHKELCREIDSFSRKQTTHLQQAVAAGGRVEKARSLSPKKTVKPILAAPVALPSKSITVNALPEQLVYGRISSTLFNCGDSEPDVVTTTPPNGEIMQQFGPEHRLSRLSNFSFTELYEIRV